MSSASTATPAIPSYKHVRPKSTLNSKHLFEHQREALRALSKLDDENTSFSTLIVLPTGAGKTYTATTWLFQRALNVNKKVLWIAHRRMLLDQAAKSFDDGAYVDMIPSRSSFSYRIVSGARDHDPASSIQPNDDILLISKDTLSRNLQCLDKWLAGEKELYLVIDEAHHATAKTYRRILDYVYERVPYTKVIGLTATPFRTAENEQGLLAQVFTSGTYENKGIAYRIGLKDLINLQILSTPISINVLTGEDFGGELGARALRAIQQRDILPSEIESRMASSAGRNRLILDTYLKRQNDYGQTIIFAVNTLHAVTLSRLFNDAGIPSEYVSSVVTEDGMTSEAHNAYAVEQYRKGEIKVLISVGILTEGVDLPMTQTVFLARPTVSKVLMTQMVGRALRGEKAQGTKYAYIVSFVDDWSENIAWASPDSLIEDQENGFEDDVLSVGREHEVVRKLALALIEEFARLLNDNIDTTELEMIPFNERFPVGMYVFSYLEPSPDSIDRTCNIMVYSDKKQAYEEFMSALPELFETFGATDDEYLNEAQLDTMEQRAHDAFFCGTMLPAYDPRDVRDILQYYAQQGIAPTFYTLDDIDRSKLDICGIARHIYDEDMGPRTKARYLDKIWDEAKGDTLQLFFSSRQAYFLYQVELELKRLTYPGIFDQEDDRPSITRSQLENMDLTEIGRLNQDFEKTLRDEVFLKSCRDDGEYCCASCHKASKTRTPFRLVYRRPIAAGGKSTPDNLMVMCDECADRFEAR